MFLVVGMAVFAHNAFTDGSQGFALFFGLYLLTITILWFRSGYHDHDHRVLSTPYSFTYLIAALLFLVSPLLTEQWRFLLWLISLIITVLTPAFMPLLARHNPKAKEQQERAETFSPSIIERFGLMTIIVLGEVIVGVVNGVISHHHLNLQIGITAFLSMSIAVALWWIYFDFIAERKLNRQRGIFWVMLHIPLTLNITAIGAAVVNIIKSENIHYIDAKYLLLGSIATFLGIIILMLKTVEIPEDLKNIYKKSASLIMIAIVIISALAFIHTNTIVLLLCIDIVMLLPIYYGFNVWIKEQKKNKSVKLKDEKY